MVSSVNVPLADVPLREVLGERLGVPVFVDNDATVAALAEAHDEQLRPVIRHLVMITVGTGIGGGLVLDGRIYRGSHGGAGELGHTIVGLDPSGGVPSPGSVPTAGLARVGRVRPRARPSSGPRRPSASRTPSSAGPCGARPGRCSGRTSSRRRTTETRWRLARSSVGRASRDRGRQRDQHVRSRGGRDRRRRRAGGRAAARAGARGWRAATCFRGSVGRSVIRWPGTASAPGVLGAAMLADHGSQPLADGRVRRRPRPETIIERTGGLQ